MNDISINSSNGDKSREANAIISELVRCLGLRELEFCLLSSTNQFDEELFKRIMRLKTLTILRLDSDLVVNLTVE